MTPEELDAQYARLAVASGRTEREWRDVLSLPSDDAKVVVSRWIALSELPWAKERSAADEVLAILNTIAQWATPLGVIAGTVTGVAGAITAIKGA